MAEPDFEAKEEDRDDFTPDEPAREGPTMIEGPARPWEGSEPAPPERERCLEVVRRVLLGEPRPHSLEAAVLTIEKELSGAGE